MSPFTKMFIFGVIIADLFAIIIFGGRFILDGTVLSEKNHNAVLVASVKDSNTTQTTTSNGPAAPTFDYATYQADAAKGAMVAGKCKACHTFDAGGPHRTGPNLWAIVEAPVGSKDGFSYSAANKDYANTHPIWNDDALFSFLEKPRSTMPGTKMQFAGLRKPEERADLIAYLKTLK